MALSILHPTRRHAQEGLSSPRPERSGLGAEKLGVVGGFLVGLPIGVSLVGEPLATFGAPQWLAVGMTALVIAVFVRIGLSLGASASDLDDT